MYRFYSNPKIFLWHTIVQVLANVSHFRLLFVHGSVPFFIEINSTFFLFAFFIIVGLEAMEAALELEKKVNKSLLDLHKVADSHGDFQVRKPLD